jgi:arabinose-5-phosphate isomerase
MDHRPKGSPPSPAAPGCRRQLDKVHLFVDPGDNPHRAVPTCEPAEAVADVMARLGSSGAQLCVVVNGHGVVQGRLRRDRLDPADSRPAEEAMEPGPPTIRADADLADTTERMRSRSVASLMVANPDGVLLGVIHVKPNQAPRH